MDTRKAHRGLRNFISQIDDISKKLAALKKRKEEERRELQKKDQAGARGAPHHLTLSDQIFDVWRGRPSKRGQAPELQRLNVAEEVAAVNC